MLETRSGGAWTKDLEGELVARACRPDDPLELRHALRERARLCLDLFDRFVRLERVRRS